MIMGMGASLASIIALMYEDFFSEFNVIVASSPASANIFLGDKSVGSTPLTLKLKQGTYTLRAKKMVMRN